MVPTTEEFTAVKKELLQQSLQALQERTGKAIRANAQLHALDTVGLRPFNSNWIISVTDSLSSFLMSELVQEIVDAGVAAVRKQKTEELMTLLDLKEDNG